MIIFKLRNITSASTKVVLIFASLFILSNPLYAATKTTAQPKDTSSTSTFLEEDTYEEDEASNADVYDPLESMNRAVFSFNHKLDRYIIHPITVGYRRVVPNKGRTAIHNMFRNLGEPITFLNATLQGDPGAASSALGRFMINSTFGVAGLFNFTNSHAEAKDFGQTLGHYGSGPGPYLVLPIFGPSNIRDGVGLIADGLSDPIRYTLNTNENMARAAAKGLDKRDSILDITDDIDRTSLDPYATYRSLYTQYREDAIKNNH